MDVYIFLRNHIGEVPVVERLPSTIYASSDEEARKQIEKMISKWTPYKSYGSIALWHSLEKRN